MKNVCCEYDRWNGWTSTLQAAWYARHAHWARLCYVPFVMWCLKKKLKNVSCEYNRLNGWTSTLQAAWYIRRVRIICFLWTKPTIWLLRLYSVLHKISSARVLCFILMKDIGRWLPWMLPGSTGRLSITILCTRYYITLIKGRDYIKHDINVV